MPLTQSLSILQQLLSADLGRFGGGINIVCDDESAVIVSSDIVWNLYIVQHAAHIHNYVLLQAVHVRTLVSA